VPVEKVMRTVPAALYGGHAESPLCMTHRSAYVILLEQYFVRGFYVPSVYLFAILFWCMSKDTKVVGSQPRNLFQRGA